MNLTLFLAQIIGVYMLVAGVSGLLYGDRMRKALAEMKGSYIMPYFDGAIALITGLLIVLTHNVWDGLAASLITAIGWLAIAEGFVMLLLPQEAIMNIATKLSSKNAAMGFSIVAVILGGYLAWFGFLG